MLHSTLYTSQLAHYPHTSHLALHTSHDRHLSRRRLCTQVSTGGLQSQLCSQRQARDKQVDPSAASRVALFTGYASWFVARCKLTHGGSCIVLEYETGPAGSAFPLEVEANIALEVAFTRVAALIWTDRAPFSSPTFSLRWYQSSSTTTCTTGFARSARCAATHAPCRPNRPKWSFCKWHFLALDPRCIPQLGYIVQAWCARKHGIGRIRVTRDEQAFVNVYRF
jgi:hypothetical protein